MTIYDYKDILDVRIRETLYTEGSYRYRALKRRIEEPLSHKISFDTYDRHIDRLVKLLIVERKEDGKKVFTH